MHEPLKLVRLILSITKGILVMEVSPVPSGQPRRSRWWILGAVIGAVVLGLIVCVGVGVAVSGWQGQDAEPTVITSTDGQSQLTVPASWSVQEDLHDDAELEVANLLQEQYVIVLTENKSDFVDTDLDSYSDLVAESVVEAAGAEDIGDATELTINGNAAQQYEVHGTVDNLKVVYWLTTVEGEQNFYQVLAWTLESKAEANEPVFQEVVQSFKEVAQ